MALPGQQHPVKTCLKTSLFSTIKRFHSSACLWAFVKTSLLWLIFIYFHTWQGVARCLHLILQAAPVACVPLLPVLSSSHCTGSTSYSLYQAEAAPTSPASLPMIPLQDHSPAAVASSQVLECVQLVPLSRPSHSAALPRAPCPPHSHPSLRVIILKRTFLHTLFLSHPH